ncbi:RXFP2 protein, partial [Polypterus senegalus]|nr:RXFP2 protein [Polypterus senegalus]
MPEKDPPQKVIGTSLSRSSSVKSQEGSIQTASSHHMASPTMGLKLEKRNATPSVCPVGHFPCGNVSTCLPQLLHCNGVKDCSNGADEVNCEDISGWYVIIDKARGTPFPDSWQTECHLREYPQICDCQETELECVDVHLHSIPKVSPNVTLLDFASNHITTLNSSVFPMCSSLTVLNLSRNPLCYIHPNQFDNLKSLQSLDLEEIEIPDTHSRMFTRLKNLTHILDILISLVAFCSHPGADCLMGIYLFFVGVFDVMYRGEYNQHAQYWMESTECSFVGFLAMLSSEVSVMLLTYLSVEKCLAITFPFNTMRPGRCQTLIILLSIWTAGFIIAFIPLHNYEYFGNYYGRNGVCFPLYSDETEKPGAKYYSVGIFLGLNVLAFLVILLSYVTMFLSIRKTSSRTCSKKRQLRNDVAIAHHFFFIVFTDALCWIPIFILKVLSLLQVQIPGTVTSWVAIFILPINSALNPILYTLTTSFFRETVKSSLSRVHRRNIDSLSKHTSSLKLNFLKS